LPHPHSASNLAQQSGLDEVIDDALGHIVLVPPTTSTWMSVVI
jgi:hypothetical protein